MDAALVSSSADAFIGGCIGAFIGSSIVSAMDPSTYLLTLEFWRVCSWQC